MVTRLGLAVTVVAVLSACGARTHEGCDPGLVERDGRCVDADGDVAADLDADADADAEADADADVDGGAHRTCGDAVCDGDEGCSTCPVDCGECLPGCEPAAWDISEDFSTEDNPSGAWTYGWTSRDGGELTLSTLAGPFYGGIYAWRGYRSDDGAPEASHNSTSEPITTVNDVTWEPGETFFHPGPADERSVLRWTAPTDGVYAVSASFYSKDAGATDVHVLLNGAPLSDASLDFDWSTASVDEVLDLVAGDLVDFTVGYGSDRMYWADTTGVTARLERRECR